MSYKKPRTRGNTQVLSWGRKMQSLKCSQHAAIALQFVSYWGRQMLLVAGTLIVGLVLCPVIGLMYLAKLLHEHNPPRSARCDAPICLGRRDDEVPPQIGVL